MQIRMIRSAESVPLSVPQFKSIESLRTQNCRIMGQGSQLTLGERKT